MRILLINLPWYYVQPQLIPDIPWGLGVIAAVLGQNGHQVSILDINSLGLSQEEVVNEIKTRQFDLVGVTLFIGDLDYLKWLAKVIKNFKSHVPIIVGGPLISCAPKIIMDYVPQIDIGVIGEGDETIIELMQVLKNRGRFENLTSIAGIAYRASNEVHLTRFRNSIRNLDNLPWPAWHLFPIIRSSQHRVNIKLESGILFLTKLSHITIRTTRGCPFRCSFCATSKLFPTFRYRSVESVVRKIQQLKNTYSIQAIWFNDDTFTFNKQRVLEFCQALLKLNLYWGCMTRTQLLDQELLEVMKKSGCLLIRLGLESVDQYILNLSHKDVKINHDLKMIHLAQQIGIQIQPFILLGLPGETYSSIQSTLNFLEQTQLKPIPFLLLPIPGSRLYQQVKSQDKIINEKEYISRLANVRPNQLVINLTNLPDDFLIQTFKRIQDMSIG